MSDLNRHVAMVLAHKDELFTLDRFAKVERAIGMLIETSLIDAPIGSVCYLEHEARQIPCEIVGFTQERCFLMALDSISGVQSGAWLKVPSGRAGEIGMAAPEALIGRVISGLGEPLDGKGAIPGPRTVSVVHAINPMDRPPIDSILDTGVGVVNSLLTMGVGQRVGLFAGSGVGKSVFLGMLARHVQADAVVVGLVGERGREVAEFVDEVLGDGLSRSIVVASPADDSPAMRLRGARIATELAEQLARQGKQVLLLMDSLTRVAQAQREIGLAMGEPAATKGYTPSSFAWLPRLVERAGRFSENGGSVTGFYTVLMEEDDLQDPVVDTARAILDGHFVLSRDIAERGIYPAIDVSASVSRLMNKLAQPDQLDKARRFRQLWHVYDEQQDLINVGAYRKGTDGEIDEAIDRFPAMCDFISQGLMDKVVMNDALTRLDNLFQSVTGQVGQGLTLDQEFGVSSVGTPLTEPGIPGGAGER